MAKRLHHVYNPVGVVSFRISKEDQAALSHAGKKPSEVAKAAVEGEARRARFDSHLAEIDRHAKPSRRPTLELVREARREH